MLAQFLFAIGFVKLAVTKPAQPRTARHHVPFIEGSLKIIAAVVFAWDKVVETEQFPAVAKFAPFRLALSYGYRSYRHNA